MAATHDAPGAWDEAIARDAITDYARRVADHGTPDDLAALHSLTLAMPALTGDAARGVHGRGYSWRAIGEAVGLRRQHAWRRWHIRTPRTPEGPNCSHQGEHLAA